MPEVPVETPPPTAEGTFSRTPLAQVLVYVLERQLTGTLEFLAPNGGDGPRWVRVLLLEGCPAKARTSEPVAYLGTVLHELGFISDDVLNRSLAAMAAEKRLHGQILRDMGAIDDVQLREGLRAQVAKKVEHVLDWPPETRFLYYDGFDALHAYGADDFVQLDPLPLVWAAIRTSPPWEHVHAALSKVGTSGLRLNEHADVDRFELTADERRAVELLRDHAMRVHELAACKIVSPAATQLLCYCLLITKQVELVGAAEPRPSQQLARVQLAQVATPRGGGIIEERAVLRGVDSRVSSPLPPPHPAASSHSRIAPPPPAAPSAPSAPLASGPPASPTSSSPRMAAQPAAVPSSSSLAAAAPVASSGKISVSKQEAAESKTKSQRAAMSPALDVRRKEILDRFEKIKSQNYFEMLGVAEDATVEQVQQAFFQLAKAWHPDRVPPPLVDVKEQCARVFSHMSEAHQTLVDPKRRAEYMNLLKEGGATPDDQAQIQAVLEAATNFQKAEICLRRQDFAQAESLVRKAHDADPKQPEYLALLAWLESMKPESQSEPGTLECVGKLDKAIALNDKVERAYFYRGMLLKRLQNTEAAVRDFRRAAELNPRNIDAVREVRLYEMRRSRKSAPPQGRDSEKTPAAKKSEGEASLKGLFGKLFKK